MARAGIGLRASLILWGSGSGDLFYAHACDAVPFHREDREKPSIVFYGFAAGWDVTEAEHQEALQQGQPPVFQPITIPYKGASETYYSYCQTHRIQNMGKQRLVINYQQADLGDSPIYLISNRLVWQAPGITRIRRHRWSVEVYHEEGKAEGLDRYQLRDFSAIGRHVAMVAVVYSLLRAAQHDPDLRGKLQRQLKVQLEGSTGAWRRFTQAQILWCLGLFISAGLAQGLNLHDLMAPLIRAACGT